MRWPWLIALIACGKPDAAPPPALDAAPLPAPDAAPLPPPDAAPSPPADPCAALAADFDAALAAATGACAADADCACHSDLRIDGKVGVTDEASAARLQVLADAYRRRKCPTIHAATAGRRCVARCQSGACR